MSDKSTGLSLNTYETYSILTDSYTYQSYSISYFVPVQHFFNDIK